MQSTKVKFTFLAAPIYETNALRSNTNVTADTSLSIGGGVQVTGQGLRNLDVVGFSAGTNSVRYASLSSKSFDVLTVSGAYQFFVGAYDKQGRLLDIAKGENPPAGLVTFNTLTMGVQNSTTYTPTFRSESVDLFTPTIAYGWQNIPLDPGECASQSVPKVKGFCYFSDITLTVGHTMSDLGLLQNTNIALATTFSKRFSKSDFVLSLASSLTGKVYESVPGGRNDLFLQIGPKLGYNLSPAASASLAVTYNQNFSTLEAARWQGWIIQPALNVAFSPI